MLFVVVQEVVLGDLKADTSYSVSVGAYTAKGDGARSKPVTVCSALPRKCAYTDSYKNILKNRATKAHHALVMIFETKASLTIIRGH